MFERLRFLMGRIIAPSAPERASNSTSLAKAQRPVEPRAEPHTEPDQIEELMRILSEAGEDSSDGPALPRGPRPKDHGRLRRGHAL